MNSFYRLKNRLLSVVNKSLVVQHMEEEDAMRLLYGMLVYQHHYSRKNYKVAAHYLNKLERSAEKEEHFSLLDLVLNEQIKLAADYTTTNPKEIIDKRTANARKIEPIAALDQILAQIHFDLKVSQNYGQQNATLYQYLEKLLKKTSFENEWTNSRVFQIKFFDAISHILLQQHDYDKLEVFAQDAISLFKKKKWFDKTHHEISLKMHTYWVNALFKNGRYTQSLKAAAALKVELGKYDNLLEDKYLIFYYNALIINYSVIDPLKAIELLEDLKDEKKVQSESFYFHFVLINLSILHYRTQDFEKAIDYIISLSTRSSFKKAAPLLQLKLAVLEMIIRLERKEDEIILYRTKQILRQFKSEFESMEGRRQREMLGLVGMLAKLKQPKDWKERLQSFMSNRDKSLPDDADLIDYDRWAKQQIMQRR
jgi:pterin-4a-carbinolamine dehydratase